MLVLSLVLTLPLVTTAAAEISNDWTNMGSGITCTGKNKEESHLSCASGFTNTSRAECLALCAEFDGTNQADSAEMTNTFGCEPPEDGASCLYASWSPEGGGTCHLDTEDACASFRPADKSAVVFKFTPVISPQAQKLSILYGVRAEDIESPADQPVPSKK